MKEGTLAAFAAQALVASPAHAQPQDIRDWYTAMHYGSDWGHMIGGLFMMVFFWGGLALVIYLIVRWLNADRGEPGESRRPDRSPLDVLKQRYARGEIDKAEYEERKRTLLE